MMPRKKNKAHRAGTIAIIGRPSIGKSTLLNRIIGEKVSITARKPQTTREQILGIASFEDAQLAFIDTPGIHQKQYRRINQVMNQAAISSIDQSDVCLLMVDTSLHSDDLFIAQKLAAGIADLLSQVLGVEVESEMDGDEEPPMDEPEMKDDLEMDDEPGGRDSMYEEESHEEGHDDKLKKEEKEEEETLEEGEDEDLMKEEEDEDKEDMKEDLVNEITRRVAKRLLDLKKK